MDLLQLANQ